MALFLPSLGRLYCFFWLLIGAAYLSAGEIHTAAEKGDLARVRALVAANPALVHDRDREQKTPLHYAAAAGQLEVAAFLLEAGAEVNARSNSGITPLYLAQGFGRKAVAELLRKHGGIMDVQKPAATTPVRRPSLAATNLMPRDTVVPPPPRYPAIIMAVRSNDLAALGAILTTNTAAVEATDTNQWTALHHAAEVGTVQAAQVLLNAGARINAQGHGGVAPLHIAVQRNDLAMASLLISNKADVNLRTSIGATPLLLAAAAGKMGDMVKLLLAAGADPRARDRFGNTALILAAAVPEPDGVAELLISTGLDINAQETGGGFSALHHAVLRGNRPLVQALLAARANPNLVTREGDTPLALAMFEGHQEIASLLRGAGGALPPEPTVTPLERSLMEHYRKYQEKLATTSFADLKKVMLERLPTQQEINRIFVRGASQVWEKVDRIHRDEVMAWGAANRNDEDRQNFLNLMRGGSRAGEYLRLEPRPPSAAAAAAKARRIIAPDIPVYQLEVRRRGGDRFLEGDFYHVGGRWVLIPSLSQIFPELGGQ
ncbi:MAG: ankyrin repeat domain-containing protein [Verrucomicrobiae bacterium]|nr:ankyrin repeat domain-containing protein [Verrucomicrobiae bacterium]